VGNLQELGRKNAQIYLERNRSEQQLSIFEENNLFQAMQNLGKQLGLVDLPRKIEGYDISHLSGKFVYGSMVTFVDGRPAKKLYKLFKGKEQNDDYQNHQLVLGRRLERALNFYIEEKGEGTVKPFQDWSLPDVILIDGGKGQLSVDQKIYEEYQRKFQENGLSLEVVLVAIAKREEMLFKLGEGGQVVEVKPTGQARFLVQRIRDESHRFAVSNNRKARLKSIQKTPLDKVPGIGPKTKQKILSTFGSSKDLVEGLYSNPELVYELLGEKLTQRLKDHFGVMN
jgi:excinuclease ABC subunit C